jgi:hypothetical protein
MINFNDNKNEKLVYINKKKICNTQKFILFIMLLLNNILNNFQ